MTPAASHSNYKIAEERLQPYLQDIYDWTIRNDLILNPDKSTSTLFTSDPHEHKVILNLTINNITIPGHTAIAEKNQDKRNSKKSGHYQDIFLTKYR